jgi:4-aminobutyrate aminotransferase-like enzyme
VKTTESIVINGYDLLAENGRLQFDDVVVCGRKLNRATAVISPQGTPHSDYADVRKAHEKQIFPNTISDESPTIDYSYPAAGMFVDSPAGVYLDLYQGVAQKIVDEHHPEYRATLKALYDNGLAFRREINTDDFVTLGDGIEGLHTSQGLAALLNGLSEKAFPNMGGYRTFFSNSGAEAGEAALKLAQIHAYRTFLQKYGLEVLGRVMTDLGIDKVPFFEGTEGEPVWADYPFFIIACEGSFHGRTYGVLSMTRSKGVHHRGFSKLRWVRHVTFNADPDDVASLLDTRPITTILDAPGGVAGVVAAGRIPADLAALFAVECFQGEGGYYLADKQWLRTIAQTCADHEILFGVDEVQSFGRTGRLFAVEHFGIEPDIIWTSKGAIVGITIARADLAKDLAVGWHSNTFGGGKFFDINMAFATVHIVTGYADPLFEGRTCLDNLGIKGEYTRMRLADLATRHPDIVVDFSGLGGMWGLSVYHRHEIVELGWKLGAKLLGCGPSGEVSRLRIILLADVLTREIDQMIDVLDRIFSAVEARHKDD